MTDPSAVMTMLREAYREGLRERITLLAEATLELQAGHPGAEQRLRDAAHALRGSGGSYGYPEITEAAAHVEDGASSALPALSDVLVSTLRAVAARAD